MKTYLIITMAFLCTAFLHAQEKATAVIHAQDGKYQISRNIYGQFSEHLGHGIYGGLWVGEDSSIPNVHGVRKDIIDALKEIRIPNLRWPGGCFADEYHWRDGIGDKSKRPKMVNTHWGGVTEDNSFGTHEFLNLCEELGTEPYICGNLGSGTVDEMSKWIEYISSDGENPMAKLRKENGRDKPWHVKFWGVGNENWGCGGNMTAQEYSNQYRRYSTYCRDYNDNKLYKIAGGPNSSDYNWMETLMKNIPQHLMSGISLHNYTITGNWSDKGDATAFDEDNYFTLLYNGLNMDSLITKHSRIMDQYDPQKNIGLVVDEWGAWHNVQKGTNPGFLYQQNTLRDALLAAEILNIFQKHCDRVKMANIAQMVNVLQALFLTQDAKMILTPTYAVFDMYKVHQDATMLPLEVQSPSYSRTGKTRDALSISASKDSEGKIHVSVVNVDPNSAIDLKCQIEGITKAMLVTGKIITAPKINSYNSFENPNVVTLKDFKGASYKNGTISVTLPAKSIVTLELR